jgi:hypothetical protein
MGKLTFTTKKKAQILADALTSRSPWRITKVKHCWFCKKFYPKRLLSDIIPNVLYVVKNLLVKQKSYPEKLMKSTLIMIVKL